MPPSRRGPLEGPLGVLAAQPVRKDNDRIWPKTRCIARRFRWLWLQSLVRRALGALFSSERIAWLQPLAMNSLSLIGFAPPAPASASPTVAHSDGRTGGRRSFIA